MADNAVAIQVPLHLCDDYVARLACFGGGGVLGTQGTESGNKDHC